LYLAEDFQVAMRRLKRAEETTNPNIETEEEPDKGNRKRKRRSARASSESSEGEVTHNIKFMYLA
jgi:hypothetical protein